MMINMSAVLIISLLSVSVSAFAQLDTEALSNPGFETGNAGESFSNFSGTNTWFLQNPCGGGQTAVSTDSPRSGTYCLKAGPPLGWNRTSGVCEPGSDAQWQIVHAGGYPAGAVGITWSVWVDASELAPIYELQTNLLTLNSTLSTVYNTDIGNNITPGGTTGYQHHQCDITFTSENPTNCVIIGYLRPFQTGGALNDTPGDPELSTSCIRLDDASVVFHTGEPIGATPIQLYTGNLSIGPFMTYWGTPASSLLDQVNDNIIAQMNRTSCTTMTDIIAWCLVEQNEGQWDWSHYLYNFQKLTDAGLGYTPFAWLHFPPKWYEESDQFVPYANLVTNETVPQLSLWSPDLARVYDEFYGRLADVMGNGFDFVRLPMPSEFGEVGYCSGMTVPFRPQPTAKSGYWCGDPYARADFRESMLTLYGSIDAINARWDTAFLGIDEIAMPDPETIPNDFAISVSARHRWLDFLNWYHDAWVKCIETTSTIAKEHFPGKEIVISLGHPAEAPMHGNNNGIHVAAIGRLGLSAQTPGAVSYYCTRRISSVCRHYGAPYYTEPPADVPRDAELNRIFMDISNGVQRYFDYMKNLDGARDLFRTYKQYMTGAPPRTNVAVWNSTSDHWLHPNLGWPQGTFALSDYLRDVMDYEIVDDRMILSGALNSLGINQLILVEATWLDATAWSEVQTWVESGGILIVLQSNPILDVEGTNTLWARQAPAVVPELTDGTWDTAALWTAGHVLMGSGLVVTVDAAGLQQITKARFLGELCENAGTWLGEPERNVKHLDNGYNGVLCTQFDDKLLYFNTTTDDKNLAIEFREIDFSQGHRRPAMMNMTLDIPARSIISVSLTEDRTGMSSLAVPMFTD